MSIVEGREVRFRRLANELSFCSLIQYVRMRDDIATLISEIELESKSRMEAFNWMNNQLWKLGLEVGDLGP